ncbi:hypothetical protein LZ31DRAFT_84717 [Colletotrichum somersetense]|nr:hypothetical protein LZ31DRAFT_84717 [Colletotrichum somersetense]
MDRRGVRENLPPEKIEFGRRTAVVVGLSVCLPAATGFAVDVVGLWMFVAFLRRETGGGLCAAGSLSLSAVRWVGCSPARLDYDENLGRQGGSVW